MCQQWFSVVGQFLDIIGFLLIAREWHWAIALQGGEKVREIGNFGKAYQPVKGEQKYMWQGWLQEYKTRKRLFHAAFVLVVLGFVCQLLGSFPYGVPVLGFKSC